MQTTSPTLETATPIDDRIKIAALWISMLLIFAYVDIFALYKPDVLQDIQGGTIYLFDITQMFIFLTTLYVVIPILMIPLTLVAQPRLNRNVNIVVAAIYALTIIGGAIGEWAFYVFGSAIEVGLLLAVMYYARTLVPSTDAF